MRNAFAEAVYQAAKEDPGIYVVVADISPAGAIERFAKEFPDRFINVGVAEQAMIGICAGLALRGCKPFAYTIAPFALYRPFEFVRDDLCYQNLPVTVVGMGAGVLYSTLGGTHHTIEDVAIACSIPNLTVIAPSDPTEVGDAVYHCAQAKGPVYLRIGKAGEPRLDWKDPWEFGSLHWLKKRGGGACIVTYGGIIRKAIEYAKKLKHEGEASIASCHTLKPLDVHGLSKVLMDYDPVIVMEEHVYQGGLAMQLKALACNMHQLLGGKVHIGMVRHITLKDKFVHAYGSHDDILEEHEMV